MAYRKKYCLIGGKMSSLHHFPDIREKLGASSSIEIVVFENNEYCRRLKNR
jgi:hypothetical protein